MGNDIEREAKFLIERLRQFENENMDEAAFRDWSGHVCPSVARLERLLMSPTQPDGGADYSQGIMAGAGAVILKDGEPLTVDEIVAELNRLQAAQAKGGKVEPLASFQDRVEPWMKECFGPEISADKVERNHRFLEESLELVQSLGCTKEEARQLVDYVYGRPVGDPPQEVGGVRVTLAALCLAGGMDQDECAETELARIWTKVPQIRAKQAAKPKHSPLPGHQPTGGEWCEWHDDDNGCWTGSCGKEFWFEEGGPSDNGMKFCLSCGKPCVEISHEGKLDDGHDDAM